MKQATAAENQRKEERRRSIEALKQRNSVSFVEIRANEEERKRKDAEKFNTDCKKALRESKEDLKRANLKRRALKDFYERQSNYQRRQKSLFFLLIVVCSAYAVFWGFGKFEENQKKNTDLLKLMTYYENFLKQKKNNEKEIGTLSVQMDELQRKEKEDSGKNSFYTNREETFINRLGMAIFWIFKPIWQIVPFFSTFLY